MKRTPLTRKTPLTARSARSARKPMQRRCREPKRGARWRSDKYLAWIKSLPCSVCGGQADAAHHLIGMWQVGGMGLKAADSFAMPTCDGPGGCHAKIHAQKALRDKQPEWLKETIRQALDDVLSAEIRDELTHALAYMQSKEAK